MPGSFETDSGQSMVEYTLVDSGILHDLQMFLVLFFYARCLRY